jgi:hypothetical protein
MGDDQSTKSFTLSMPKHFIDLLTGPLELPQMFLRMSPRRKERTKISLRIIYCKKEKHHIDELTINSPKWEIRVRSSNNTEQREEE